MEKNEKLLAIKDLLEVEGRMMLCINATLNGVDVPFRFKRDNGLRLILNRNMPQPIDFTPQGIETELGFGGLPHYCIIPYHAIWGAYNPDTGQGTFWPEDMTDDQLQEFEAAQQLVAPLAPKKPTFKVITGSGPETPPDSPPPTPRKRSHLKIVK